MKKTTLTCLISVSSLIAFSQDIQPDPIDPIKSFLLNDFKTANLLKNVKKHSEAIDSILKNKSTDFLSMTDSVTVGMTGAKVKYIKIYSNNKEFDSENEFFTVNSLTDKKQVSIDLNAKMNIKGKAREREDDNLAEQSIIQDVIAKETKDGYKLILKRSKIK